LQQKNRPKHEGFAQKTVKTVKGLKEQKKSPKAQKVAGRVQ
jgi:hypothetical protein